MTSIFILKQAHYLGIEENCHQFCEEQSGSTAIFSNNYLMVNKFEHDREKSGCIGVCCEWHC